MQHNDLAAAADAFRKVTQLVPKVGAGHSALGAVLVLQGKPDPAVSELETALRLSPQDNTARLNLGLALAAIAPRARSGAATAEQAIHAFAEWQQATGSALPPDAAVADATLLAGQGRLDEASRAIESSLAAEPNNVSLLDASGVLLAQAQNFAAARDRFQQAAAAAGADAPAALRGRIHMHLGTSLLALNDAEAAERELRSAVQLAPAETEAAVQLGVAQFTLGRQEEALQTLRKAQAAAPRSFSANYQLALALQSAGKADDSLPFFEAARTLTPAPDAALLTNLGLAMVQTGKAREAIAVYERALALDANSATLHQDLGVAYLQQSDLDHALVEFQRAFALEPKSGQIAYDIGLAYKLKDKLPEAIASFEQARSLDPTLADAPYTLGVLYMQQGRFADAAASLQQALSLDASNTEAWSMLGSVLKQDEKPAEAAEALRKAIALDPQRPGDHVNLAAVLMSLGQKEEAVRERRIAADLSRTASTKQKERFALDSGRLLMQRGQFADAVVQFRNAVAADPNDAAAHLALADALSQTGAKAEAQAERSKAQAHSQQP